MSHSLQTKKTESLLQATNEKLKIKPSLITLNKAIHVAMHDVRSPLTSIKPYLDFLKRIDDTEKRDEILDRMKENVRKMESLMNGLVRYADLICDEPKEVELINFEKLEKIIQYHLSFYHSDVTHEISFEEKETVSFHYPKNYLEDMVRILLDNSFKYRAAERSLKIVINIFEKDGKVNLQIKDNGAGIPDGFTKTIACQAFSKNTNAQRGIGLGFASLTSMLKKNGGDFEVEKLEEGTCVTLNMLPYPSTENIEEDIKVIKLKMGDTILQAKK